MPISTTQPAVSRLDDQVSYQWSDGTLFTGFLRVGLIVPQYGGTTDAAFITLANQTPGLRIPLNTMIQITDGKPDTYTAVFQNSALRPPNSRYTAWWYDSTGALIAGPSAAFTISTSTFSPPAATLTSPSVGSTIPPSD